MSQQFQLELEARQREHDDDDGHEVEDDDNDEKTSIIWKQFCFFPLNLQNTINSMQKKSRYRNRNDKSTYKLRRESTHFQITTWMRRI